MTAENVLKQFEEMDLNKIREKAILIEKKINEMYMEKNKLKIKEKFANTN